MTCNLDDTFQVLCQTQQKNHLDISCSFFPHSRECRRKSLLEKDERNVMLCHLKYADLAKRKSRAAGPGCLKTD